MILALDIGGTKLATAAFAHDGTISGLLIEPTRREEGPDTVLSRLMEMGHRSLQKAGVADNELEAVGISCGGPLDAEAGVLLSPPHLPGWDFVDIGTMTREEFHVPFALENDATAAALGQWRYGAGKGTQTMLYLTLSTGVGGGSIIHGKLHRGAAGNGGELGHIMVQRSGRLCISCGRGGCLEAYCSGTAIAARAREAVDSGHESTLASLHAITAADVSQAAKNGDPLAVELWQETTNLLGQGLTDLTNVFEPELIVLGGGVTNAGSMLIDPVRSIVKTQAMGPAAHACSIVLADRPGLAGIIGAGAIGVELAEASMQAHTTSLAG